MDKFREPEQFDAEVEIHDGEPFAVWAPAVNGSHVKAEVYFALLAELEAKDERIGELEAIATDYAGKFQKAQDALKYAAIMSDDDKKKIAELEKRLATPVRLPRPACTYADHSYPAYSRKQVEEIITSAGMRFTVEGDE